MDCIVLIIELKVKIITNENVIKASKDHYLHLCFRTHKGHLPSNMERFGRGY